MCFRKPILPLFQNTIFHYLYSALSSNNFHRVYFFNIVKSSAALFLNLKIKFHKVNLRNKPKKTLENITEID